ncbi:MAG: hypothetical protein BWX69_00928 [Planctomycetes bacterium ADurb.Bin069]|nr:MAG: hypothetical protein BWX69_00928 [Planctomycetes bacterium ADurb.Bin069]
MKQRCLEATDRRERPGPPARRRLGRRGRVLRAAGGEGPGMTATRRNALLLVLLTGAWLGLTCAAALHHCPDDDCGGRPRTCEFYGHSLQAQARADADLSHARADWNEVPTARFVAPEDATPADPFDRSCWRKRAPPA